MRFRVIALGAIALFVACAGGPASEGRGPPPALTASAVPVSSSSSAPPDEPAPPRQKPGAPELVKQLDEADGIADATARWYRKKALTDAIAGLADPRGAEALAAKIARDPNWTKNAESAHFTTLLAFSLAELSDLRALSVLARRLELDPLALYSGGDEQTAVLRRDDSERVVAARLIRDLAVLHPDARERIRHDAETAVMAWLEGMPQPHANGIRALARMGSQSEAVLAKLRAWADPPGALPNAHAQPPLPSEWMTAQTPLRYLGALHDKKSWSLLEKQLKRRPAGFDASMDSLTNNGGAILGMTLRALGHGAADGFSEWGDPKAFPLLLKYAEDDKQNEQSRSEACLGLGWVVAGNDVDTLLKHIEKWIQTPKKGAEFSAGCLLSGLGARGVDRARPRLLALLRRKLSQPTRLAAARGVAWAGLDAAAETELEAMLGDPELRVAAALALLLAGSPDRVEHAIAALPKPEREELGDAFGSSLVSFTDEDLTSGRLYRWLENTGQASEVGARERLANALSSTRFDSGPHSLTRVVLRMRLYAAATGGNEHDRKMAAQVLELMQERGILLGLEERSPN